MKNKQQKVEFFMAEVFAMDCYNKRLLGFSYCLYNIMARLNFFFIHQANQIQCNLDPVLEGRSILYYNFSFGATKNLWF